MKKCIALLLILMLLLPALAMGENVAGTITIGIFEPASGDNAAGGKQETLGMYYANSLVNTVELGGKTYKVEVTEVDNQTSADKAPAAAQTLVSRNVNVVLGTYGSGASMAAAPIFEAAGIPAIGASCTNPGVTLGNPLYWRICYTDDFQGDVLANFAFNDLDVKIAYTLNMLGEDYGAGLVNYFTKAFEKLGGKVVADTFPEGTSDFSAYLQNAVNAGAGVIFSPSSTTYASLMLGQAVSMNLAIPFVAGDTWASSVILEAVQNSDQKVYFSDFFDESDKDATQVSKDFVTGFKAWLNANPQNLTNNGGNDIVAAVSALGYDGYMVALEALKKADSGDRQDIADIMDQVTFDGVTGAIVFGENGDAVRDQAFIKKSDNATGAWTFVKVQGITAK
jgi:branched-chain amino acid transport system substrate-binding protein